jgi:hypothetical protein
MIKLKKWNKKGSFFDIFIIIAFIFGFVVISVFGIILYNKISVEFDKAGITNSSNTTKLTMEKINTTIYSFDYLFVILLGGLIIATIIGAFMIESHPIFLIVAVILLFLAVFAAYIYWYQYNQMLTVSEDFAEASNTLTIMPKVIDYLPYIALIVSAIIIIVMVAKSKGGV